MHHVKLEDNFLCEEREVGVCNCNTDDRSDNEFHS